jgi:hypothetical protein
VTKEKSRLQIILGRLFFDLPAQYNSFALLTQTVLLTKGLRNKPQNSRYFPKFSEAIRNPKMIMMLLNLINGGARAIPEMVRTSVKMVAPTRLV